jgi:hypothetical protein
MIAAEEMLAKSELERAYDYLTGLLRREHCDNTLGSFEVDWVTADGIIVARGVDGIYPHVQFVAPWKGMSRELISGSEALELMKKECGAGPWGGGPVRLWRPPMVVLYGPHGKGLDDWREQIQVQTAWHRDLHWLTQCLMSNYVVAIIYVDDGGTGMDDEEFCCTVRRPGFYDGPMYGLSKGDEILAHLGAYIKPAGERHA